MLTYERVRPHGADQPEPGGQAGDRDRGEREQPARAQRALADHRRRAEHDPDAESFELADERDRGRGR